MLSLCHPALCNPLLSRQSHDQDDSRVGTQRHNIATMMMMVVVVEFSFVNLTAVTAAVYHVFFTLLPTRDRGDGGGCGRCVCVCVSVCLCAFCVCAFGLFVCECLFVSVFGLPLRAEANKI